MYTFAIFVTYAIQFYVPMSVLYGDIQDPRYRLWKDLLLRVCLVTLTCIFAIAIPDLGDFIALIGACASSLLALGNGYRFFCQIVKSRSNDNI